MKSSLSTHYTLDDLLYLMSRLRKPVTGCPWDLKQSYSSITPSTLEEVYEVVDAIEREDFSHLSEELGDLLFQIVFYAQLGKEDKYFEFDTIVHDLTAKLIRRHPHVFPSGELSSELGSGAQNTDSDQAVGARWEKIKKEERVKKGQQGVLVDVPLALPSLQRAQKLQKRIAKVGMDWRDKLDVLSKVEEEIAELKVALVEGDLSSIEDEFGDVLFSCVNLGRHLKLDSDHALRKANSKFESRIHKIEQLMLASGQVWEHCSDEELDELWWRAKSLE